MKKIIHLSIILSLYSCNTNRESETECVHIENTREYSEFEKFEYFRFGDFENKRIEYIYQVYKTLSDTDTTNLIELYTDSIETIISELSKENIDGIKYDSTLLIKAWEHFVLYNSYLNSAEISPTGTQYYVYQNDKITYNVMSFYFQLKWLR